MVLPFSAAYFREYLLDGGYTVNVTAFHQILEAPSVLSVQARHKFLVEICFFTNLAESPRKMTHDWRDCLQNG